MPNNIFLTPQQDNKRARVAPPVIRPINYKPPRLANYESDDEDTHNRRPQPGARRRLVF